MRRTPAGRGDAGNAAKVKAQFRALDTNRDNTLSFKEVKRLLKSLNPRFSERQLQALFCEVDSNQNGKIELNEFLDFVLDGKKSEPAIRRAPPRPEPEAAAAAGVRDAWKQATLEAHNARRAVHGSPPLGWNDECYLKAKKQADACQARGSLFHGHLTGPSGRHGQNAYWCSVPGSSADAVTGSWYDELHDPGYNFDDPGFKGGTGHFTQVVWKGTTHVGMAVSEDGCFVVANYLPAGNVMGHFQANVAPPSGKEFAAAKKEAKEEAKGAEEKSEEKKKRDVRTVKEPAAAKKEAKEEAKGAEEKSEEKKEDSVRTVKATELTPELEAIFEGCPHLTILDDIKGFASKKGTTVEVTLETKGQIKIMKVTLKALGFSRQWNASWGSG